MARKIYPQCNNQIVRNISIMGALGVGKTTLVSSLKKFLGPQPTVGDIRTWFYVKTGSNALEEAFPFIVHQFLVPPTSSEDINFLATCTSIVVVYEATNNSSYETALQCLDSVRLYPCQKILVCNKCDCRGGSVTGVNVDSARAEAWNRNAHYIEMSAKLSPLSIQDLWNSVACGVPPSYVPYETTPPSPQVEEITSSQRCVHDSNHSPQSQTVGPSPISSCSSSPGRNYIPTNVNFVPEPRNSSLVKVPSHCANPTILFDVSSNLVTHSSNPSAPSLYLEALSILSGALEIGFEDIPVMRMVAYKMEEWRLYDQAKYLYERILQLCSEPQSYLDLAQVLLRLNDVPNALHYYKIILGEDRCPHEYCEAALNDPRFEQIEITALLDTWWLSHSALDSPPPPQLRITLKWNSANTDLDLIVTPNGATNSNMGVLPVACTTFANVTEEGGWLTRDFNAYGPEEFILPKVSKIPSTYSVSAKVCSHLGPPTASVVTALYVHSCGDLVAMTCTRLVCKTGSVFPLGTVTVS
ncbi:hypothetical protein Pelo_3460 [Pelomyxa schiedti]|nr:hypothetical protein Pelo_3460 [Pelomyxa schiedti]